MVNPVKLSVVFLLWNALFCNYLIAQDTLILIDRHPIVVVSHRFESDQVFYIPAGKKREKSMEADKVFSIRAAGKPEQVVYRLDTLENNWYTADQMSDYIRGQHDAQKGYLSQANKTGSGGVMVGFAGAATGLFYGPLFIIGYTGWKGYTRPQFTKENGYNEAFTGNVYYQEGFGTAAKRMVSRRSALGSAAGFVLGVVTLSLVLR